MRHFTRSIKAERDDCDENTCFIDEKTRDSHLVERLSDYFGFDVEFDVMWEKQVLFNEKNAILYRVRAYDDGIDQGEFEICIYQR